MGRGILPASFAFFAGGMAALHVPAWPVALKRLVLSSAV
jgi:hypothetical protein